jgi:hypothetical protein
MSVALETELILPAPAAASHPLPAHDQNDRIRAALGLRHDRLPKVDARTLSCYYDYLRQNLSLPFAACYPEAKNLQEENEYRCEVFDLIDPANHLGDGFDGIFCQTRKGAYEINLPLIDLHLPEDDPNFQLIEDYWYWFWNWR